MEIGVLPRNASRIGDVGHRNAAEYARREMDMAAYAIDNAACGAVSLQKLPDSIDGDVIPHYRHGRPPALAAIATYPRQLADMAGDPLDHRQVEDLS